MKKSLLILPLLLLTLSAKESRVELGLGLASLYYPDYIGSKSSEFFLSPLPYVRYRGEYLTLDEDGITGKLFGINGLRLEMSMNGSLPASSERDGPREGMPDLELTGEIGAVLIYTLFSKGVALLEFELPLRWVLSTEFSKISYRGLVSNPQLKYSLNYRDFSWTLRLGGLYADKIYHNYFYGVKEIYSTTTREAYDAKCGFGGIRARVGVSYKKERWWGGAFVSYYDIKGATYASSPLVESNKALYMGASLAYIFYTSD